MSIHESIAKISKELMFNEPFYGMFLLTLNKVIRKDIPTAAVCKNGINVQLAVNEEYWNSLPESERYGLLKHELLHIVFFHLHMRSSYPDHLLFNLAADIEVNQYLAANQVGKDWITLNSWPDLNLKPFGGTSYYYEELKTALQNNTCPNLKANYMAMIAGDIVLHGTWSEFEGLNDSEAELIKKQIDYQLKEVASNIKGRGTIPGELKGYIDSLFEIKPSIFDWKSYLRRFLKTSIEISTRKSRRKLNRRFTGMPAIKIKPKINVLAAVDTSGSVSDGELIEFFNEIYHIWKTGISVTVLQCDADIHDISEYDGKFNGRIAGRGGTNFQPVIDYYNKHIDKYTTLVFLTDGYCSMPTTPRGSMMWVMSSNSSDLDTFSDWPGYKIKIPKANG